MIAIGGVVLLAVVLAIGYGVYYLISSLVA